MKALTLWQPWASFMVALPPPKRNETRSWSTSYRGPLAIHAAKREPAWVRDAFCGPGPLRGLMMKHLRDRERFPSGSHDWRIEEVFDALPRGTVVGFVTLTGVARAEDARLSIPVEEELLGDYSDGRFAWRTERPIQVHPPIPVRGRQGLWTLPDHLVPWRRPLHA